MASPSNFDVLQITPNFVDLFSTYVPRVPISVPSSIFQESLLKTKHLVLFSKM